MAACTWEDEARRADEAVDGGAHLLLDEALVERGHVGTQLGVALRPPRTIRRRHHPPEHPHNFEGSNHMGVGFEAREGGGRASIYTYALCRSHLPGVCMLSSRRRSRAAWRGCSCGVSTKPCHTKLRRFRPQGRNRYRSTHCSPPFDNQETSQHKTRVRRTGRRTTTQAAGRGLH